MVYDSDIILDLSTTISPIVSFQLCVYSHFNLHWDKYFLL